YGVECLFRFYTYGIEKHFQQETLCDHEAGQLYDILKNCRNLEDFRVDGASFPQQFFPTKSNYNCSSIRSNLNSLKSNGEQYLNDAKLYTRFVFLLFCLK
ncbi:unnamed protein product, partial [Rotaria sordida]